jgi:hypothetical protein
MSRQLLRAAFVLATLSLLFYLLIASHIMVNEFP